MNRVILVGRITADPEIRYSQGAESMCIARFSIAVDRKDKDKNTDFINCVAFGKRGEFLEKYGKKGIKFAIVGKWQTGSYTNKDGNKVYTNDCVVDEIEFCESKGESKPEPKADEFMSIPEGMAEELPFK